MTTVYNPFRDMDRVFTQLARTAASEGRSMPMDLYRDGDEFIVKIDLPGVSAESIDIDVDDRTLTVRAERSQEEMRTVGENNRWVSRERSYGSYARQLTLGPGLNLGVKGAQQPGETPLVPHALVRVEGRAVLVEAEHEAAMFPVHAVGDPEGQHVIQ